MKQVNEIREELKDVGSILADISRAMPYHVPDGYFSELAGDINKTITSVTEREDTPTWSKIMPFSVPTGYFNQLPDQILAGVVATGLPKVAPFGVPRGYFDKLPGQMLQAAKEADKPAAKIISLQRSAILRQLRWAAAALLVTGIGLGGYNTYQQRQQTDTENILSSVPSDDVRAYVQGTYRMDVDKMANNTDVTAMQIDNKDIIQYLDETGWD